MVTVILGGVILGLLGYIYWYRQQVRQIRLQLEDYNQGKRRSKVRACLQDGELERLAVAINDQIQKGKAFESQYREGNHQIRQMIASIAHDLRTPLTSMLGYLQVIGTQELTEVKQEAYIQTTYRRAKDLERLLSEFFNLSILDSPEYQLNLTKVAVDKLLCELLAEYYERFECKGITPSLELPKQQIHLIADVHALRRIIENLLGNMLSYTSGGVGISLIQEEGWVKLIFWNEAKGLSEEEVVHLFERFYIRDRARSNQSGRTGLGLAIVKELVERMDGQVSGRLVGDQLHIICKWQSESQ